jgi:DNA-binding response OmpR family regulator
MPYRDGFEVLRAIRNDPRVAHLPVLILSMRDREEDIVRGLESGADEYVVKPFNAREFVARVRKLLAPRRG